MFDSPRATSATNRRRSDGRLRTQRKESTKKFLARRDLHLETVWRAIEPALSPRWLGRSCCAENDEPLVELGVRCLWVVCFGYCRVRGMVAPRSWNARRWVSVGWASVGTVVSVPAKWTWLRVRVPRWVSSPW